MDIRDRKGLKAAAAEALASASYDPKKLIVMHTAASVVVALALSLMDHMLQNQIGGTGGLSGVGHRAVLETAQTVLMVAQFVAAMFWQIGYIFVALRISRRQEIGPESLLEGFRQFGPVLRLRLSLGFLYTGMGILCMYAASTLFSLTPWAAPMMEAVEVGTEEAMLQAVEACAVPLMGIMLLVMLVVMVPYTYRLRMTDFALMDNPRQGAMMAIRKSRFMMRGNRMDLFKMDLSFWWFYGLETLISMVAYGDLLLPMFGVELPWSETVSFYVFLILCYAGQLALYWWKGNEVQVTYAKCYEALLPREKA